MLWWKELIIVGKSTAFDNSGRFYLKDESPMLGCAGAPDALIPVEEWSVEKGAESTSLLLKEGLLYHLTRELEEGYSS